ncbi:Lrp/AsnC family transcriptional regulator [Euzebya pacifica]|jgi:DNA-binding Lrp family transcriptional regulator|uniref:Lrp/AsnC family transcriptional regulator n=1 Tax=Euzebya pacifica TaxID=1608957 RepID=UPI000DF80B98|nr:Lrp/AsnC family transcriptional regulator [Euzebya pacifica]
MDDVDMAILRILRDDGRITLTDLADRVHVSRTNVHGRIGKLHERGVVHGYTARINSSKVGLPVAALVLFGLDQTKLEDLRTTLDAMSSVEHWGLTMGAYDGFLTVRVASVDELRKFLVDELRTMPGITRTESVLLIEETGPRQALP